MLEVLLIRPGSTTFDNEGRIKGALDIPLSQEGIEQARELAKKLASVKMDCLYVAPAESAQQSAAEIARLNFSRSRTLDCLRNLDHGLWQGKLVSDIKRLQPKIYRQFQEQPEARPPGGESVQDAVERIQNSVNKLLRRHRSGRIGIVVPQPLACIVRFLLVGGRLGDPWKSELDFGTYEVLQVEPQVSKLRRFAFA